MKYLLTLCFLCLSIQAQNIIWQEAESLQTTGGWSNDPQHIDIMGSPYLLATGIGEPVKDAFGTVKVNKAGTYTLWVRCRDWYPSHSPGQFTVSVDSTSSKVSFGKAKNDNWQWINGGEFDLKKGEVELRLTDTTGWWSRVDALVLSTGGFKPSNELAELNQQRIKYNSVSTKLKDMGTYDVVIVGGGSAGIGAALSAARHGIRVAFIQDRPVLGGNASDEIQVPPMGYIGKPEDKVNVTGIAEEVYPVQGWKSYASSKLLDKAIVAEKNIDLFLNTRAIDVDMADEKTIKAVVAIDVHTGQRMSFTSNLFIDTTGHGWVGHYAGAEYRHGTEAKGDFNESMAPEKANNYTMGNSLYKLAFETSTQQEKFNTPAWAYQWTSTKDFDKIQVRPSTATRPKAFDQATEGKGRKVKYLGASHTWFMEYGGIHNTITDAEKIRDNLFRMHIGIWGYQKNYERVEKTKKIKLVWMNYIAGVRESRRLMGDYIMTQKDFDTKARHADAVAFTDWGVDDHHPYGFFTKGIDVLHPMKGYRVTIPYRSLYSKNISNLFMAGRCMSASHLALAGVRVERPMLATGQAVGTAAALASKNNCSPRDIYKNHLGELQQKLLKDGCFIPGIKNNDQQDLALNATSPNRSITDGWNRAITNISKATPWKGTPIELKLKKVSNISEIHLSLQDRHKSVDFDIEEFVDGKWEKISGSSGSIKKRRFVMKFTSTQTDKLRFILKKSSGPVSICEIRIYQ
ncbi:MAG: FAD-dependent oxidoreductase [Lentisphaeraceae bacterium]|nr:FAD-dependent oxidoreductase [Lentisphaeraceae bacterium]